jgi:hypothetical protein
MNCPTEQLKSGYKLCAPVTPPQKTVSSEQIRVSCGSPLLTLSRQNALNVLAQQTRIIILRASRIEHTDSSHH